jgi:cellulose 1,4-beta-cellobiosidase
MRFNPLRGSTRLRLRSGVIAAAALVLGSVPAVVAVSQVHAAAGCSVNYAIVNQWNTGFQTNLTITNLGDPITSWTLAWDFTAGQQITQLWSGTATQTGQHVSVTSLSWNSNLGTGGQATPGFTASLTGSNPVPASFTLNGTVCTGGVTTSPTPSPTGKPSPSPSPTANPSPSPTPSPIQTGPHPANPYAGANGYVNPDWAANVKAGAAAVGGTLGATEMKVASTPTAVWLDRIAAVTGGTGVTRTLGGHLDAAVAQAAANPGTPVVITIVVYDLPNRDCAALASNGELLVANNGLAMYKTQYIDQIVATINQPKYANLRIAAIVEPDSLPNLVTNLSMAKCAEANSSGAYVQGIQYALGKLHALSNVWNFVDIAHSGWLGWSSNFGPAVNLIGNAIKGAVGGVNSVDGFISDTANYTPVQEPFMTVTQTVNGQQVRSSTFYQFNDFIDEINYTSSMRTAFVNAGFPSTIGMLIDTSRSGWGGPNRPTAASTSTDVNTFVQQSKIDRRVHRGNWCNQKGGLGARPVANPAPGFDAWVWIKPPGESDGASQAIANSEGKGFDPMCDPTFHGSQQANGGNLTEALPNAPLAGHWFQAAFDLLTQQAFPPIQ